METEKTNMHKLLGNALSQTSVSRNWKETRKCYCSKKSFSYKICARTSKATHRVFQLRVCLLLGSFTFFITCSSLHGNYGLRLGASSIRDVSSNRSITVVQIEAISFSHSGLGTSRSKAYSS